MEKLDIGSKEFGRANVPGARRVRMKRAVCMAVAIPAIVGCATMPRDMTQPTEPVEVVEVVEDDYGPRMETVIVTTGGPPVTSDEEVYCSVGERFTTQPSCTDVYYGTNRTPDPFRKVEWRMTSKESKAIGRDVGAMYGPTADKACEPNSKLYREAATRSDVCHIGKVTVSIPQKRNEGEFQFVEPGMYVLRGQESKYFWTVKHHPYCARRMAQNGDFDAYCSDRYYDNPVGALRAELAGTLNASGRGHALVFVHGFNVEFRNAAFRAAQLKHDMNFQGPVFFYSWPSNGVTTDYFSDQVDGDLSVDGLVRFLNMVREVLACEGLADCEEPKIHIIAHSMGARITAQALARIGVENREATFGEVFFAAGDVDHALFQKWIGSALPNVDGVTIYTSRHDGAVGFASFLRNLAFPWKSWGKEKRQRIGFVQKGHDPFVLDPDGDDGPDRVDTIDISAFAKTTGFYIVNWKKWFIDNHSTYAQGLVVTDDMLRAICDKNRPDPFERSGALFDKRGKYWKLEAVNLLEQREGCSSF